jgi:Gas vesicle protein
VSDRTPDRSPPEPASVATAAASGSRPIAQPPADTRALEARTPDERRLVLSDLVNRVLDRGLMITGSVTLAVADIDLVQLDLNLVLTAVEAATRRTAKRPPG